MPGVRGGRTVGRTVASGVAGANEEPRLATGVVVGTDEPALCPVVAAGAPDDIGPDDVEEVLPADPPSRGIPAQATTAAPRRIANTATEPEARPRPRFVRRRE
jgi:hypothetical protein